MMDYVYNNGELFHARSHKYIKREWHNGRWRYYYSNGLNFDPLQAKQGQLNAASAYKTVLKNDTEGRIILKPGGREALTRNMAAHLQEVSRIEAYEQDQKKPINIAKSTVKSISTAVGSTFDKGKKWLSSIIGTKTNIDYNPKPKYQATPSNDGTKYTISSSRMKKIKEKEG